MNMPLQFLVYRVKNAVNRSLSGASRPLKESGDLDWRDIVCAISRSPDIGACLWSWQYGVRHRRQGQMVVIPAGVAGLEIVAVHNVGAENGLDLCRVNLSTCQSWKPREEGSVATQSQLAAGRPT